jgi:DNA-3-methyladenine glycosylase II
MIHIVTLKKRLVECYGEKLEYNNEEYFLFPTPQAISKLAVEDLKQLQFTTRKADYTIMKCFDINDAFPIADVGIHNALKDILRLAEKPTIDEIEKLSVNWRGWQAYATFYLWREGISKKQLGRL